MMDAWLNFARFGDPNHGFIPTWEKYEKEERWTMIFDIPCRTEKSPREEIRLAWEKLIQFHS